MKMLWKWLCSFKHEWVYSEYVIPKWEDDIVKNDDNTGTYRKRVCDRCKREETNRPTFFYNPLTDYEISEVKNNWRRTK